MHGVRIVSLVLDNWCSSSRSLNLHRLLLLREQHRRGLSQTVQCVLTLFHRTYLTLLYGQSGSMASALSMIMAEYLPGIASVRYALLDVLVRLTIRRHRLNAGTDSR